MSDSGDVFIYPFEFSAVVASLRQGTAMPTEQTPLVVPYVFDVGATETLAALKTAVDDARLSMAGAYEIAARGFTVAQTKAIEADMIDEGVVDWTLLPTPDVSNAPTDDPGLTGDVVRFLPEPDDISWEQA